MSSDRRLVVQLYYDILRESHLLAKAGKTPSLYNIAHRAGLPHSRLKVRVDELRSLGMVDSGTGVTERGYEFCEDYVAKIDPVLRKYGLGHREDGPAP